MVGPLVRAAAMFFVPVFLALVTSELLGIDKKYTSSDALLQAMAEVLRTPTVGRTIISVVYVAIMYVSTAAWSRYVGQQLTPEHLQVPAATSTQPGSTILCSAKELEGRSFAGASPEGHMVLRINRVRDAEVDYSLLRGGKIQNAGKGAFDKSDCTLVISDLSSRARAVREGSKLLLMAVEPRWTLQYFESR